MRQRLKRLKLNALDPKPLNAATPAIAQALTVA
jgi:hypothetical protein